MTVPWSESIEAIASFLTFNTQIRLGAPRPELEGRMSRSSFFSRSSRDNSPLLPQHNDSVSLRDLSPREASSRAASPSPPPSFYRAQNEQNELNNLSLSPSPSRTKARRIQFAAPPPPIAGSVILPLGQYSIQDARSAKKSSDGSFQARDSSPRIRRGSGGIDPLLALERTEKAIQNDLQLLLDAQSAGLMQGFGGDVGGDASSDAGSSTPTTRSLQRSSSRGKSGGIVPVRQPKRRVVGLRGARKGLLRDMGELAAVKREEVGVLMGEIGRREEVLGRVDLWEKRIEGVRNQLSEHSGIGNSASGDEAGGGEEGMEIAELRTEERAVDNEIREMEDRLAQMNARKLWLGERIKESVNKREARLSSYRGALREVESEAKEFLKRPPINVSIVMGDEEGFAALPPGRRTLGMAKEWWNKEVSQLQLRKQEVEKEKSALEEGAQMWEESISIVTEFEDDLRKQMASNEVQNVDKLRKQIGKMGGVIIKLGATLSVAEERGWNLLICAVGAELEAFKEGEGILRGALGMSQHDDESQDGHEESSTNGLNDLHPGLKRSESFERDESEDDGPNLAELLVDRGDPDDMP
jgi:hypothetical protein